METKILDFSTLGSTPTLGEFIKFCNNGGGWQEPFIPWQVGYVLEQLVPKLGGRDAPIKVIRYTRYHDDGPGAHYLHEWKLEFESPLPTEEETEETEALGDEYLYGATFITNPIWENKRVVLLVEGNNTLIIRARSGGWYDGDKPHQG